MISRTTGRRLGVATLLAAIGAAAAFGVTTAPARAARTGLGISCPASTSHPFQRWGDNAAYVGLPDGGFEAGASGWALSGGARVVAGNEPFFVNSSRDKSSLSLPAGSSATSPPMCIALLSSKMRFFIGGGAGSSVRVQVVYNGLLSSVLGIFDGGTVTSNGQWAPSPALLMLGGAVPLLTKSVQFRFVSVSGSAQIDDVYLDPWKVL